MSANCPAYPENNRNGRMKTALTMDNSWPARVAATVRTASIETTILNRLSLKAPRNWVQRNDWSPGCFNVSRYVCGAMRLKIEPRSDRCPEVDFRNAEKR